MPTPPDHAINAYNYFISCGLSDEQAKQAVQITTVLFRDNHNAADSAGVILMSVSAFIVECVRNGIKVTAS